jgi:hypothetical protein
LLPLVAHRPVRLVVLRPTSGKFVRFPNLSGHRQCRAVNARTSKSSGRPQTGLHSDVACISRSCGKICSRQHHGHGYGPRGSTQATTIHRSRFGRSSICNQFRDLGRDSSIGPTSSSRKILSFRPRSSRNMQRRGVRKVGPSTGRPALATPAKESRLTR